MNSFHTYHYRAIQTGIIPGLYDPTKSEPVMLGVEGVPLEEYLNRMGERGWRLVTMIDFPAAPYPLLVLEH